MKYCRTKQPSNIPSHSRRQPHTSLLCCSALLASVVGGLGCKQTREQSAVQSEPVPFSVPQSSASAAPQQGTAPDFSKIAHFVPESARADNHRPLLLFLHGLGGSGRDAFDVLQLAELGRRHQTFVLAPDGNIDSEKRLFWNAHPACCNFDRQRVDHVSYLDQVVTAFTRNYPVDPARLFAIGFSNGGFMAHRLACEWGDRLAGVASVAGGGPEGDVTCQATKAARVIEVHGDADVTVRYEGGTPFDRPGPRYGSARSTFDNWAKRLQCGGTPIRHAPIDLVPSIAGAETDRLCFENCPGGSTCLWTVHRGSHMFGNTPQIADKIWLLLSTRPS